MKSLRSLLLFSAVLGAALTLRAADGEMTTASVAFSDPAKPGTLRVNIPWADLRITGTDAPGVTVRSNLEQKGRTRVTRDGLRRIDESVAFELLEQDNVVTLALAGGAEWHSPGSEFEISVPHNTNLVLSNGMGGDIRVTGVEGDLDVDSMNGDVSLDGIASSAVVNTMNGQIKAAFKSAPTKPVSLTTMNGEINVHLPAETKASLRLRTHNGSILTDFPEDALQTQTETRSGTPVAGAAPRAREADRARSEAAREAADAVRAAAEVARTVVEEVRREVAAAVAERDGATPRAPRAPRAPRPPTFGGKSITGTLNGGGTDIALTSMNGTITLRQGK